MEAKGPCGLERSELTTTATATDTESWPLPLESWSDLTYTECFKSVEVGEIDVILQIQPAAWKEE